MRYDAKIIAPHDPRWAGAFRAEAERIRAAFGESLIALHHIGSTAVEALWAKPTIDILLEARSLDRVDARAQSLVGIGYEARGEYGIAGRRYFVRRDDAEGVRGYHLHAFRAGDAAALSHLRFRDRLRADPEAARAYCALKRSLADPDGVLPPDYQERKADFIRAMLA